MDLAENLPDDSVADPRDSSSFFYRDDAAAKPLFEHNFSYYALDYLKGFIPFCFVWLRTYRWTYLFYDIIAGLVTASMFVPQGLAYALLAQMSPITGLYSGIFPCFVYAILGSSMHVVLGPVALSAILASDTAKQAYPGATEEQHTELIMVISFLSGIILVFLSLIRFGFVTRYFSNTVMRGFVTASGLIIAFSQIKWFFGLHITDDELSDNILVSTVQTLMFLGRTNPYTVIISSLSMAFMILFRVKGVPKWLPGPLLLVVSSSLLCWGLQLPLRCGIRVVGMIPGGMPQFSLPKLTEYSSRIGVMLPGAVAIGLVSFIGQIALGQLYSRKNDQPEVDAGRELFALGISNIATSFVPSQPANASFSRSAVNEHAGNKTPLSNVVCALIVILVLEVLTSALHYLPMAVLGVIVIDSVGSLLDYNEFLFLWRTSKAEAFLFAVTALATLGIGIQWGIVLSLLLSVFHVLYVTSCEKPLVMNRCPEGHLKPNVVRPDAKPLEGDSIVVMSIPNTLFFGSVYIFCDLVESCIRKDSAVNHALIIDMTSVLDIDASSLHAISACISKSERDQTLKIFLGGLREVPYQRLKRSGITKKLAADAMLVDVDMCWKYAERWVRSNDV